jgi:uncharacterized protein YjbI with pentapeptide repeats
LRNRWTAESSEAGIRFLVRKGSAPFPALEDGFEDLRGLTIDDVIEYVTASNIDLSGARTEGFGQFGFCSFSVCRFENAALTTNTGKLFQKCNFTSATFLGGVLRGKFVDCNFTSTNLKSTMASNVQFVRCIFSKTNLQKAGLYDCLFEDCQFESCKFGDGSLGGSKFRRTAIDQELLGDTVMGGVTFS